MRPKEIEILRSRSLHLDCTEIELVRGDRAESYKGPGYIRQEADAFALTVFVARAMSSDELRKFFCRHESPAGQLIPEERLWSMQAIDLAGRTWASTGMTQPHPAGYTLAPGFAVNATTVDLSSREERHKDETKRCRHAIQLRSFLPFEFPRNTASQTVVSVGEKEQLKSATLNVATLSACGIDFELREESGDVVLTGTADHLPEDIDLRVSESLLFALGVFPVWSINKRLDHHHVTTRVAATSGRRVRAHRPMPLRFLHADRTKQVWRLFELYLKHILDDAGAPRHLRAVSAQLYAVEKTNAASVEAQALTLAVAVEAVLNGYFAEVARPSEQYLRGVDNLLEHVKAWQGDNTLIERARGAIGAMKHGRARDKLRELQAGGVITEPNLRAWESLRNPTAHGILHPSSMDLQVLIDRIEQVRVLLYRLILHLIGYRGPQTDWAAPDWPQVDFPPATLSTELNSTDDGRS